MDKESESNSTLVRWVGPDYLRKVVATIGLVLLAVVFLAVAMLAINVFLVAFAGVLLGIFLLALRDVLVRRTVLTEKWALAAIIFILLLLTTLGAIFLVPQLADQADDFTRRLPKFTAQAEEFLEQYGWGRQLLATFENQEGIEGLHKGVGMFFSATVQTVGLLITFLGVGFFIAVNPGLYLNGVIRLFPPPLRPRTQEVLLEIGSTLRWFLVARAIAMFLVGLATAIALMLIGVPLALFLGVLAGLLTFIPYLGPIIAGVPIIMVALLEGSDKALYALIVYTAIQQLEGNLFDPLILQRVIRLAPVATLLSQILGAVLLGPMGIMLATPFAAVVQTLLRTVYREDVLGETPEEGEKWSRSG